MTDLAVVADTPDPEAGYRRWAQILFGLMLLVLLAAGGLLLLSGVATDDVVIPLLAAALTVSTILLLEVVGVHDRRPWAVAAIAPMCAILIVAGLVKVLLALGDGNLTVPLEAVGAILVLSRRPASGVRPALDGRDEIRRALIVVPFAVLTFWPLAPTV
jgi:hypothetical protein